jgi:hypothetical protein
MGFLLGFEFNGFSGGFWTNIAADASTNSDCAKDEDG